MQFKTYQYIASKFADYEKFKIKNKLEYLTIGMVGEAGEVANKIKKILRHDTEIINEQIKLDIAKELGDVLWYMSELSVYLGFNLNEIAEININKLNERKLLNTIRGVGDGSRRNNVNETDS